MNECNVSIGGKQQLVNGRILIGILTIGIIFFSVFLFSSIMDTSRSQAFDEDNSFKYYTSIEIASGDTLWTIANQYISPEYDSVRDYIEEVKLLNNMGPDDIYAGQYLMVPYYSAELQE